MEHFPVSHHYNMLADLNRMLKFQDAILKTVTPTSVVVDLGTGTGILSHFALQKSPKKVFGIEYFQSTSLIAQKICSSNNIEGIEIINNRSYDVDLNSAGPNVLISETIGPVGPEENIVELCFDFKNRHPSIEHIIPQTLTIWGQKFFSKNMNDKFRKILQAFDFSNLGCLTFSVSGLYDELDYAYSSTLKLGVIDDANFIDDRILITNYELGYTQSSKLDFTISFKDSNANGFYMYFESILAENIMLTNNPKEEYGHWYPAYIKRPEGYEILHIAYAPNERHFNIKWT